jgi:hypothetical protein
MFMIYLDVRRGVNAQFTLAKTVLSDGGRRAVCVVLGTKDDATLIEFS